MNIVVLDFKTVYRNGGKTARDMVLYGPRDSIMGSQIWEYVDFMRPDRMKEAETHAQGERQKFIEARWAVIGPKYEKWKASGDVPETGTPLRAWAGVNPEQIKELARHGVLTVEDLAAVGENMVGKVMLPDLRTLASQAQIFLDSRPAAEMSEEMAKLREELDAAKALLAEQMAPKPKGRPRKSESA